ncbi:MAG: LPS assembly protein LptD, partial [Gammaproteobacteria bacterium]|nr:LPS assembly protein LptD [Gammaproteobacteria bacterium]
MSHTIRIRPGIFCTIEVQSVMPLIQPKLLLPLILIWPNLILADNLDINNLWKNCPVTNNDYQAPVSFSSNKDETRISAKQVQNAAGDITSFSDEVIIERNQLRLSADKVIFDRPQQKLEILGNIHIDAENLSINSDTGWLELKTNQGEFNNSHYYLPGSHFRGSTPGLSIDNGKQTLLIDSSFTSCPENNNDWSLNTSRLKLDHETQTGTARHAVLWFKSIPLFYTPYISFPLGEERRSGFLMPQFGSSSSRGGELGIPWYWNIAPNQDAVITPRVMKKRGTQLKTDYRYLTESSRGDINIEYLDKDKQLKEQRHLLKWVNHSDIGQSVDFDLLINDASDTDYLEDLGSSIDISNTTHLERNARLSYNHQPWTVKLFSQSYETLDTNIAVNNRPYRRLPQITITASDTIFKSDFTWSLNSEWVDFKHESNNKINGQRFDAHPKLSWPLTGNAWYLVPSSGLHHSSYSLTDSTGNKLDIKDRNLSISSIDAGLFFEREAGSDLIQTLEPRLFYLYIPYRDQSTIPLFDTGQYDFSFSQLFRENRFTGVDRIGDTNQLSFALTSRLLDTSSGNEYLSMSIGQIFYNQNRAVSLDNSIDTKNQSDTIAEISSQWRNLKTRATVQWNPETREADKQNIQLQYKNDNQLIFNM